ncbi:flagellar biosynthesis protein FlhF [uncultured Fretibacterium sp.]|uniref:flagellar biosynthesis protein FlhF n=1 Tax=uncultured Fretibacterium sp. TaxID=1678694 RepID=UPI0026328A0A|nr:flagellar biosynthesis protein FlhF [uncultured Fretibacterium sp.]
MRVVNQITFEAKDDADAMRLAVERLGPNAVIFSTRTVRTGGVWGFFQRTALLVTAGIIEDSAEEGKAKPKPRTREARDDGETRRENLIAFQKLMEFKDRTSGGAARAPVGEEGYRPQGTGAVPEGDRVQISQEGLQQPDAAPSVPAPDPSATPLSAGDAKKLMDEVGALSQRVEALFARLAAGGEQARPQATEAPAPAAPSFHAGLPAAPVAEEAGLSAADREIEQRLRASEVDEKYVRKLLADYGATDRSQPFTDWLALQIACSGDDGGDAVGGRKVMLLGSTGVGKTTTIAKLAAIQALLEHRSVLLLTSDTYRIAAVDQLRTYAKILGVPIEVVFEAEALGSILSGHEGADLVLLDTAGRAQRDARTLEVFESLYDAFQPDAVHLVLAANMKYRDMLDVTRRLPDIPISHLLFTKLDETVSYGAIFNVQQEMGLPVSFLTAGQNVPKDIEVATGARIADFLMTPEGERLTA